MNIPDFGFSLTGSSVYVWPGNVVVCVKGIFTDSCDKVLLGRECGIAQLIMVNFTNNKASRMINN